jgi:HlyD family secretion protein
MTGMQRRQALALLASALLVALAAVGLRVIHPSASQQALQAALVDRGDVASLITATGTLRPVVTTDISTQVSGQVAEVLVDFNDEVREHQLLARLDPQTFRARVREAQAQLDVARAELASRESALAKVQAQHQQKEARLRVAESDVASAKARHHEAARTLERRRKLAPRGGVSDSDLENAETEFTATQASLQAAKSQLHVQEAEIAAAAAEVAMGRAQMEHARATIRQREAALEEARVNLQRTEIRSPLDGVVIRRDVEVGQTVAASLQAPTLFALAQDLSRMRVETFVDEADIGRLRPAQEAFFTVDAYPGRQFEGRVTVIRKAPNLIQNVVTYTVLVEAENPDLALFPGMTAVVRVIVEEVRNAVRIPNAALRFVPREPLETAVRNGAEIGEGRVLVWRLGPAGDPSAVSVSTGASDDHYTVMLDGPLQAGDRLVTGYAQTH